MIRYWLTKFSCFALSMVLAASACLLVFGGIAVGLFHGDGYIARGLEQNREQLQYTIGQSLAEVEALGDVPSGAYDGALASCVDEIEKQTAHNFVYSYETNLNRDTALYNALLSASTEYCSSKGVQVSAATLSRSASLAVDYINETVGGADTTRVSVFRFVRSQTMMIVIVGSVIGLIGSVVLLDVLNRGRHRKFSYIGMGTVTAGYLMTFVPLYVQRRHYVQDYVFCAYQPFDNAVRYCVNIGLNIALPVGAVLLLGGIVMLLLNYNYFRKKKLEEEARRAIAESKDSDYMDNYNQPSRRGLKPGEEFEKEIRKINFDE